MAITTRTKRRKGQAELEGVARLLDWRGTLNAPYRPAPRKRDGDRIAGYWAKVGGYLCAAMAETDPPRPSDG